MLVLLAVAFVALAVWAYHDLRHRRDLPTWLVTIAARWLPADRREWADALLAEVAVVRKGTARWAYALAAVRLAALPPARRPQHLIRTAGIAAAGAVVLSTVAMVAVPTLAPFVATLAVLLAGYATVYIRRSSPRASTTSYRMVTLIAVTGISAVIGALWLIALGYPSATADHDHILSSLLAVLLTGYLGFALRRPTAHAASVHYSAAAGALSLTGVTVLTTTTGIDHARISPMLPMAGIGVCLVVAIGVAAATGNAVAARRAGVLTAILAAPLQFAVAAIGLVCVRSWTLPTAYDQAAYPRSGYPDVASYMISDALGGYVISIVLIGPLILGVVVSVAFSALGHRERAGSIRRPRRRAGALR